MAVINVQGCTFSNHSSTVGQINEYNNCGWEDIETELTALHAKLGDQKSLRQAVEDLTTAVRAQNKTDVKKTISTYIRDFTSGTFAGLASATLLNFIKSF